MYTIEISPAAERDLRSLKNKIKKFNNLIVKIGNLSKEPRPYGVRKIKGLEETYRIRFLFYRIIYDLWYLW